MRGTVIDFDTNAPISNARVTASQTGWGLDKSGLVWDKTYLSRANTDANGRFDLRYDVGDAANLSVDHEGYSHYYNWQPAATNVTLPLRRLAEGVTHLRDGMLRFGLARSGPYGWSFADSTIGSSCTSADFIPSIISADDRSTIRLRACGRGGLRFVPAESLHVANLFLVFADSAAPNDYRDSATVDFRSHGGVYFVRTRDGSHFAKFALQPSGFGSMSAPDIVRDLMLQYVYDPAGGRRLPYAIPPLP